MYDYSPVGKISIQHVPTGIANFPDNYQQKMNDLFHGFEFISAYIYDLLFLTKGYWTYHVQKL